MRLSAGLRPDPLAELRTSQDAQAGLELGLKKAQRKKGTRRECRPTFHLLAFTLISLYEILVKKLGSLRVSLTCADCIIAADLVVVYCAFSFLARITFGALTLTI